MPRNCRNFWLEAEADGRASRVAFGPRAKDGGLRLSVYQRDGGQVRHVLRLEADAREGLLTLRVWDSEGRLLDNVTTRR